LARLLFFDDDGSNTAQATKVGVPSVHCPEAFVRSTWDRAMVMLKPKDPGDEAMEEGTEGAKGAEGGEESAGAAMAAVADVPNRVDATIPDFIRDKCERILGFALRSTAPTTHVSAV